MTAVSCSRCGKQDPSFEVLGDDDGVPLGWSIETERGRVLRYCTECLRDNIRSIEAKLPEEWWG